MKKNILFIAVLFLAVALLTASQSYAASTPAPTPNPHPPGPGGETCDLTAYKDSICMTESTCHEKSDDGYTEGNSIGASGRYQFIPTTAAGLSSYQSMTASAPECRHPGVPPTGTLYKNTGLATVQCAAVQEAMMDEFTMQNLAHFERGNCPEALTAIGTKTVGGCGRNPITHQRECLECTLTWSGLLAASHLGGAGGGCALAKGSNRDDGATDTGYYACIHGGLPVPSVDCTPQEYSVTSSGVTTTYQHDGPYTPWIGDPPPAGPGVDLDARLKSIWVASLQQMTNQLVTTMMQQAQIIGTFFDAKHHLETERLLQQKTAEAHKRYHPSEQLCKIGTFTRNLNESEERTILTHAALTDMVMARAKKTGDASTVEIGSDQDTQQLLYLGQFCNKVDNAGQMEEICTTTIPSETEGADINFTQSIGAPLTINIDLLDSEPPSSDEVTLFSFMNTLFMHNSFPWLSKEKTELAAFIEPYMEMRSLIALRSVAQNSIAYMIAQKAASTPEMNESAAPFLRAMLVDMGIEPDDIDELIGENPSYYAQMEFLTRKIYYHPEFISNLYDKPDNVKRMAAAMTAIKSMQNWQIHEALERREMLYSVLLELKLRDKQRELETVDIPTVLYGQPDLIGP